jgi:phage terminase large subunit
MGASHQIKLPNKLIPVFSGTARVRGAYGGRGSGKTRTFATMAAVRGLVEASGGNTGIILCAREFQNSLDDSSMAEVKAAIADDPWLASMYEVGEKYIRTKDGRVSFAFSGLRHNLSSLKSKAKILLCWVDEAEPVTDSAWSTLIPTVREEGSEIWVTWNPLRKGSATDTRFKGLFDPDVKIVEMNWRDNPKFPHVLEIERQRDLRDRPDQYPHIWEGEYLSVQTGAYYARNLAEAKEQGRITNLVADPLMTFQTYWDIGSTSDKADATAIWVAQVSGGRINVLDYYEASGQPLATHLMWLNSKGYTADRTKCWLPHDGGRHENVYSITYDGAIRNAGYSVEVVKNQGKGAAMLRIEAMRRRFNSFWFDAENCSAGLEALGWYHEKIDEHRQIGLGPDHDWSSHAADAAGLMAITFEQATTKNDAPIEISFAGWG